MSARRPPGSGHLTGFTLIELMVVVAVVGVLAAAVTPSIQGVLLKSRDARRKSDLHSIQVAVEMHLHDRGYYPQSGCGWDCNGYHYSTSGPQWISDIMPYLQGGTVPRDPINNCAAPWSAGCYSYAYGNVGRYSYSASYDLTAQLENKSDPDRCQVSCYRFYFSNQQWCAACGGGYSNQIYEIGPLTQ